MKTIKGKITRIMKDDKFEVGPRDQISNAGMHRFTSILISGFHEGEFVDIAYNPETGLVMEMKSAEPSQKQPPPRVKNFYSWGGVENLPYTEEF